MFVVLLSWISKKVKYEMIRYVAVCVELLGFAVGNYGQSDELELSTNDDVQL